MAVSKVLKILLASGTILLSLWLLLAMFTAMNLSSSSNPVKFSLDGTANNEEAEEVKDGNPWRSVDLMAKVIPPEALEAAKTIQPHVTDIIIEGATIVLRRTVPAERKSNYHILFLHGAQFDSEIWEKLGTMQLMTSLGYSCTAVDLPGYGKSSATLSANRVNFMSKLFERLKLDGNVVMVSPSMSGGFSLPFILTQPQRFAGFVPIAPVGTSIVPQNKLHSLQVPTLYLYGSKDTDLGVKARNDLKVIPNLRIISMEQAGHAAYLDKPETFHKLLYNFLLNLE